MKVKKLHELGKLIVACETYIVYGDKVLMHKRAENKKKFPGFWIGPGGHVDNGENVFSAAIREVKEETGVNINKRNLQLKVLAFHHHLDRGEVWIEYLFRAKIASFTKIRSTNEGKSEWVKIANLLKMKKVFPPSKYYFKHIFSKSTKILYNFSTWKNTQLVKVQNETLN